jgi:hypothetical protein
MYQHAVAITTRRSPKLWGKSLYEARENSELKKKTFSVFGHILTEYTRKTLRQLNLKIFVTSHFLSLAMYLPLPFTGKFRWQNTHHWWYDLKGEWQLRRYHVLYQTGSGQCLQVDPPVSARWQGTLTLNWTSNCTVRNGEFSAVT